MKPMVECVPNFSEGRRPEVVNAIVNAVRSVPGTTILDCSSDPDHNRTVLTFVGTPDSVEKAAFGAIKTAAALIDMTQHTGEHPRIGATDVVPFVPIRGVTMSTCIEMARRLGQHVGQELGIPVYLYEQAATRPDRENLANLRKGEYEGLRDAIKTDPDRAPDFGPCELGTAGATVIGARAPLIAYNVYLNTDDVETASKIARAIRHSNGGLRFVKALGLLVEGQAQISINLTDYTRTPIHRVQEMIKAEAARYGYCITHSEVVGMIPEQALIDSARWYLQLDLFDENQILEWKIQQTEAATLTPSAFLDAVASGEPTPGGGSVAALVGALAASLAEMVARLTIGRKKYEGAQDAMQNILVKADSLRSELSQLIDADSAAFEQVMAAQRLDKNDPSRLAAIQSALKHAADIPLRTARLSVAALELLKVVAGQGNINAVTDAASGSHMAVAALEAARLNVLVNLMGIEDAGFSDITRQELQALTEQGRGLAAEVIELAERRMGLR